MKAVVKLFAVLMLIGSPSIAAAGPEQVVLNGDVKVEKTVTENGVTRIELVNPSVVLPGDRVLFVTRFSNGGTSPVSNFVVTNPLPAAVSLVDEPGNNYTVSVDGGKTFGPLTSSKVSDGKGGLRKAVAGDVTHLRWVIATIQPGTSGKIEFHAIVR